MFPPPPPQFSILNSSTDTMMYFLLDPVMGGIYRTTEAALNYETDPKVRLPNQTVKNKICAVKVENRLSFL